MNPELDDTLVTVRGFVQVGTGWQSLETRATDSCLATIRKHHFQILVGYSQSSHFAVYKLTASSHIDSF